MRDNTQQLIHVYFPTIAQGLFFLFTNHWVRFFTFLCLGYYFWCNPLVITLNSENREPDKASFIDPALFAREELRTEKKTKEKAPLISQEEEDLNLANEATAVGQVLTEEQKKKAASKSNISVLLEKNFKKKHGIAKSELMKKDQICLQYVSNYAPIAQKEAEIYGIPASITLAQGLLESNAGQSKLAKRDNNHFGIKCKAKCRGCRCANYTDDDIYDMFRIFDSAWESYREHSILLTGKRYRHLKKYSRRDYKSWARGIKAAGYATDKGYAQKLIRIIEYYNLQDFDKN